MRLAQNDQMIHALATNRSDQPLGKAILPGRGRRGGFIPDDAFMVPWSCAEFAPWAIPIAHEIARHFIPGECLG
jgi:hypothetical protein